MAQLIVKTQREQRFLLQKRMTTVGTEPNHDILVPSESPGLAFTLVRGESGFEILPGSSRVRLNGQVLHRATRVGSCDRIEWNTGAAIFVQSEVPVTEGPDQNQAIRSLSILHNLAQTLQAPGAFPSALHQALDALVEMASAEAGYLLSDLGGSGWELIASRQEARDGTSRKELFSSTILREALERREPVCVESIVGHPWAEAASVIEARIFSVACFPLCLGERTLGAAFLFTRSPGRSIRRESLPELSLLATQVALLLGLQLELKATRSENARLRSLVGQWPSTLVFNDASPMSEVARKIQKLAPTPLSVLVLGETGTGKEVVARELHLESGRASGKFVAVNCAAIPQTLLESTLFGHERGAFTGAVRSQPGKFALADGGTLFLDEIGDLPLEIQAKLLRALQERQIEPLGASRPVAIDARVIAATHQDLESAVRSGRFRQDLFYRLNGAILRLPPLRERKDDIPALAAHFVAKTGSALKLSPGALDALKRHAWPGNVRELEQVLTRASLLAEGSEITEKDLELAPSSALASWADEMPALRTLQEAQLAFTQDFVQRALDRRQGNRAATAADLGVSERTLYRILSAQPAEADIPGGGA